MQFVICSNHQQHNILQPKSSEIVNRYVLLLPIMFVPLKGMYYIISKGDVWEQRERTNLLKTTICMFQVNFADKILLETVGRETLRVNAYSVFVKGINSTFLRSKRSFTKARRQKRQAGTRYVHRETISRFC